MISGHFQGTPFNIMVIQVYAPPLMPKKLSWSVLWRPATPSEGVAPKKKKRKKKRCPFSIGDWNAKVRRQEILRITSDFGLGVQSEAEQRLTEFHQQKMLGTVWKLQEKTHFFNNPRDDSMHGHHQMVNTKTRLIMFFAAKDGEALYSPQKHDLELTMSQIMNFLLKIQT